MTLLAETAIDVVCENRHSLGMSGNSRSTCGPHAGRNLEMVYTASQSTTVRPDHGERMT